jgi:sialic acid synthase SpsE
VIEKHFTLDRALPGPDHKASLEPAELAAMVRAIRDVEAAQGDGIKRPHRRRSATARWPVKAWWRRRPTPRARPFPRESKL